MSEDEYVSEDGLAQAFYHEAVRLLRDRDKKGQ